MVYRGSHGLQPLAGRSRADRRLPAARSARRGGGRGGGRRRPAERLRRRRAAGRPTHSWCGIPTPWRLTRTAGCWRPGAGNEPAAGRPAVRGAADRIGGAVQPVCDRRVRRGRRRAVVGVAAAARHVRLVRGDQRAAGVPGQPVRVGAGADADLERPPHPAARHRDHPGGAGVRDRRRAAADRVGAGRRSLRAAGRRRPRAGGAGPGGTALGDDRGAGLAVAAHAGAGRDRPGDGVAVAGGAAAPAAARGRAGGAAGRDSRWSAR